jgi:hypothetical protein
MRVVKGLILFLLMLTLSQSAFAWGGFGHGCIAYVAEQHLTPEAKEKCRYYLRHTLPYYASWMDHWRGSEMFKQVNSGHTTRAAKGGEGLNLKSGAMAHLVRAMAELGDGKYKYLPDSVVRQRLINMIHYVGDMHCPSHVSFSKKEFPQYRGQEAVRKGKKMVAYHAYWDGSPSYWRSSWEIEDYAKNVDKVSRKRAKAYQSGTLEDWGRDIARGAHRGHKIYPEGGDFAQLNKKTKKATSALADEMAMQAAYRLAYVLNTIFADKNIAVR